MESMAISVGPFEPSIWDKKGVNKAKSNQVQERPLRTLKRVEEKKYHFPDLDVPYMLEDLRQKKLIKLLECKQPGKMNRTDNLRYCKYCRVISHPVEKCFVLKDLIMKLA